MIPNKHNKIKKLAKKLSKKNSQVHESNEDEIKMKKLDQPLFLFRQNQATLEDDDDNIIIEVQEADVQISEQKVSETKKINELPIDISEIKEQIKAEFIQEEAEFKRKLQQKLKSMRKTVLFPNSILEPVQTIDLENQLIGKLARQFCIYKINSVMVFNDESYSFKKKQIGHDPSEFIIKILQYLETPQYLRKQLFPISNLLKNAGLLNPVDCLHHLKVTDISPYREGVTLKRPTKDKDGSWADIGLYKVT